MVAVSVTATKSNNAPTPPGPTGERTTLPQILSWIEGKIPDGEGQRRREEGSEGREVREVREERGKEGSGMGWL